MIVNRHIKKKFLHEDKTPVLKSGSKIEVVNLTSISQEFYKEFYKSKKIITLNKNQNSNNVFAFIHKSNDKYYPVPLPDFSLCYFNYAYFMLKSLNSSKQKLEEQLSSQLLEIDCEGELFNFYGYSSSFVIHLFTSLESFVNSMIPNSKKVKFKKQFFDREFIIKKKTTIEKIKYVLTEYYRKDYFSKRSEETQVVFDLKDLRNDIIHMEIDSTSDRSTKLFRKLLNFKYQKSLDAIANLMNLYKPGYVEPCDCSANF